MYKALIKLMDYICVIYFDDIVIFSQNQKKHKEYFRLVYERLKQYQLYAKLSKCEFFKTEIEFLGFIINTEKIKINPRRVVAIKK